MKKVFCLSLLAAALSACTNYEEQISALQRSYDSLQQEVSERDENMKLLSETLTDVTAGIDAIKERENIINVRLAEGGRKAQIQSDLDAIEQAMNDNKKKIANLRAQLAKSNKNSAELQTVIETLQATVDRQASEIENLKQTISEKDIEIHVLNTKIDKVSSSLDSLSSAKHIVDSNLSAATEKLQTGYYIVSDKSTLKSKGFVTSGLFKGVKPTGKIDTKLFTRVNIDEVNSISLGTRKAQIVTSHPDGSYNLSTDASTGLITLVITDKTSFWSMSKSLIVIGK